MSLQPYLKRIALHSRNGRTISAFPSRKDEARTSFDPREQLKVSKVGDTTVASIETNQPASRLSVFFKAGSRYETDETQGVVHMLRICAGLGNSGSSHLGLTRHVEAAGGTLTCTTGREFVAYTMEAARDQLTSIDKFLQNATVNQVFKPWEIHDNIPRMRLERNIRSSELRLMELIHKAAFRKGLGYSLYSPKWMIGNHSSEMLSEFVRHNFVEAAVVGVGMPHEQACDFASRLNIKSASRNVPGAKFHAGQDLRKETTDKLAYVALAVEGPALKDPKKAMAGALVQRALASSPRTPPGLSPNAKLSAAISGNDAETAVGAFSASYSDSGLVGAYIAATPKTVDAITRKVAEILRSAKFSADDAKRAKGILQGDLALVDEPGDNLVEYLGCQSLFTGKPLMLSEQLSLVDSVTPEDMNAILSGGKLSMATYGHVSNVPYLDQLK